MEELREIEESSISVLNENKEKGTINIMAPWVEAGVLNKNNRKYPLALLKREVNKVQGQISSGAMIGTGDHGTTGHADIKSASHIVNKMWLDEAGKGYVEMRILGTERGKTIQEIIKAGGRLGLSSRGFGTVDPITQNVKNDYVLSGIDIVMNPSASGATFNKENIFESVDFSAKKSEAKMGIKSKEKQIQSKVTIADVFMEARIAGIDPKIYAEKLNAGIDRQNAALLNDNDYDEESAILREASAAGININNPDVRKKTLAIYESQKNEKTELSEKQKLVEKVIKKKEQEMSDIDYLIGEKMLAGK